MAEADRFRGYLRAIRKQHREEPERAIAEIEKVFFGFMSQQPEALQHDLLGYFVDHYFSLSANTLDFGALSEMLTATVELFEESYEYEVDIFTNADWDYIRECVSDSAVEMDQRTLTYIMKKIVAKGLLG